MKTIYINSVGGSWRIAADHSP